MNFRMNRVLFYYFMGAYLALLQNFFSCSETPELAALLVRWHHSALNLGRSWRSVASAEYRRAAKQKTSHQNER